jgi:hypothetical protein
VKEKASLEEIVSREAVARIRTWLLERGKGFVSSSLPRLAIKFCGGCNPRIERGTVASRIQEGIKNEVDWVSGDEARDLTVIINGCLTACADTGEDRKGGAAFNISGDTISP